MNIEIRSSLESQNIKTLAEIVSKVTSSEVKDFSTPLSQNVDILFLGTGANSLTEAKEVKKFIHDLDMREIDLLVIFSCCGPLNKSVSIADNEILDRDLRPYKEYHCPLSLFKHAPNEADLKEWEDIVKDVFEGKKRNKAFWG